MNLYINNKDLEHKVKEECNKFVDDASEEILFFEVNTSNFKNVDRIMKLSKNVNSICIVERRYALFLFDFIEATNISLILIEEVDVQLEAAICSALRKGRYLSTYFNDITKLKYLNESFTKRDLHIAEHLVRGLTYEQIAKETCLSTGTIRNYVSRILSNFNMDSKVQLALYFQSILDSTNNNIIDEKETRY